MDFFNKKGVMHMNRKLYYKSEMVIGYSTSNVDDDIESSNGFTPFRFLCTGDG